MVPLRLSRSEARHVRATIRKEHSTTHIILERERARPIVVCSLVQPCKKGTFGRAQRGERFAAIIGVFHRTIGRCAVRETAASTAKSDRPSGVFVCRLARLCLLGLTDVDRLRRVSSSVRPSASFPSFSLSLSSFLCNVPRSHRRRRSPFLLEDVPSQPHSRRPPAHATRH